MNGAVPFIALKPCGCVFSDASIRAVVPNLTKGLVSPARLTDEKPEESKAVVEKAGNGHMVACPNCGKELDPTLSTSTQPINPSKEVQEALLDHLLLSRASAKANKKRKAGVVGIDQEKDKPIKTAKISPPSGDGDLPLESDIHARSLIRDGGSAGLDAPPSRGSRENSHARATPSIINNNLNRSVQQKLAEQESKRLAAQAGMSDAVKSMFKSKEVEKKGGAKEFFGRTFTRVSWCLCA